MYDYMVRHMVARCISLARKLGLNKNNQIRKWFDYLINKISPLALSIQNAKIKGLAYRMYMRGIHEPPTTNFLKKKLVSGMVVVDVGAAAGYYTVLASQLVGPTGRVLSFEPDRHSYKNLLYNIKVNHITNATAYNVALSNKLGEQDFFIKKQGAGVNSLYKEVIDYQESYTVTTSTLDAVFVEAAIDRVDIIKVDVEGAELLVLAGMQEVLKKNPQCIVLLEVSPKILARLGYTNGVDFLACIRASNFDISYITESGDAIQISDRELLQEARKQGHINICCKQL